MKSLQERIEWYERHFPEMAEQGLIRFFASHVPEGDDVARQNFQGDPEKIGRDRITTRYKSIHVSMEGEESIPDEEQKWRAHFGIKYVSEIYLSGKSAFQKGLTNQFNFSSSPDFDQNIENDFIFFHELAHKIHSVKHSTLDNGQWLDLSHYDHAINWRDEDQRTLYDECVADAFATLMTIKEHGLNKGIGFTNLVSDFRLMRMIDDDVHMSALSIDDAIQTACGHGKFGEKYIPRFEDLQNNPPQSIFTLAEMIARQNPMFTELKETGQSLKEKTKEVSDELIKKQKPLRGIQSLSPRLKDRFNHAVHRRISLRKGRENEATQAEKMYDGPWADANAKYLHSRAARTTEKDLDQDEVKKYAQSIKMMGFYLFRLEAKNEVKDRTNQNIIRKLMRKLGREDYKIITASIDHFMEVKHNDDRRKTALDLMKNATKHAKGLLNSYSKTSQNRLALMNGRKPHDSKPS